MIKIFVMGFNKTIFSSHSGKIVIGYITGVRYINAVIKTEYKCIISLNFTVIAAKTNPTPREKNTIKNNGIGTRSTVQCNSALVASITKISAVKDAIKLIKLEKTFDNTNRYLGTYTFFINAALETIEDIALVVESEKKLNITCPLKI